MDNEYFFQKVVTKFPSLNDQEIKSINISSNNERKEYNGIILIENLFNNWKDNNSVLDNIFNLIPNDNYVIIKYVEQDKVSIKNIKSIINFFVKRVFPKIPIFSISYNFLFNRKNKSYSKAEVWGRLMYAGFDVQFEETISTISFLLCKKISKQFINKNPSYYPVIKLKRVGYKGELFNLYKVRTMYPYSEFIQRKIYEMNKLSNSGKFQNDFRITEYGKFFRKFWIDELPQILNLIKFDIKLVGIRAMSEHYFSLYPDEYKNLYKKVRPGFLSPLYSDTSFDCIVSTEKKYLEEYLEHPIKTDIKYFFKITKDILSGKRSA